MLLAAHFPALRNATSYSAGLVRFQVRRAVRRCQHEREKNVKNRTCGCLRVRATRFVEREGIGGAGIRVGGTSRWRRKGRVREGSALPAGPAYRQAGRQGWSQFTGRTTWLRGRLRRVAAAHAVFVERAVGRWAVPDFRGLIGAAPDAVGVDGPQIAPWRMILAAQRASSGLVALARYLNTCRRDDVPKGQWRGLFRRSGLERITAQPVRIQPTHLVVPPVERASLHLRLGLTALHAPRTDRPKWRDAPRRLSHRRVLPCPLLFHRGSHPSRKMGGYSH